jgi:hypothetical protein
MSTAIATRENGAHGVSTIGLSMATDTFRSGNVLVVVICIATNTIVGKIERCQRPTVGGIRDVSQ